MATSKTDTGELFLSRLSETYICRPGDNVLLECYVRHQRVKSIVWYANGEMVEPKGFRLWHRYQPATGQCALYIRSVLYSDEGSYCCQAIGLDNAIEILQIRLKIDNSDKSWTKIPILHMAGHVSPEDEDESNTIFLTSPNQKSQSDENMFPMHWYELRIDRPLLNPTIVNENTPLQLSCRIAGLHIDKFEWYKNGELIPAPNESPPSSLITTTIIGDIDRGLFHTSYDTLPAHFIPLLTVDRTSKRRHEGTYECRASNAHYHVSSSCNVMINELEQTPRLSIDESISSQSIIESKKRTENDRHEQISSIDRKRLRLDETIGERQVVQSHQPLSISPVESPFRTIGDQLVPSMESKKDLSKTIKWNEQIQTLTRNDLPNEFDRLLPPIPEIGSSSDESTVISAGSREQVLHSHSVLSTHPSATNIDRSSTLETGHESLGMCPVFFQLLPANIECEESERLLLSCQVMAGTQCQIRWLINEIIISENASRTRRHYNPDTGICFIIIDPTKTNDSGLYRLIISNRHGQAQSTCQVRIVVRQLPPMPEDDVSTRLHFVKPLPLTPITCRDGDTIQLTCVVHGRRPIYIRWFKDNQQVVINEKQQHTRQIYFDSLTGKSTLTIHDIYPTDSGIYRCEATNQQEKESTNTTVDVIHYQYEGDSDRSSLSYVSGTPSEHEDATGSQFIHDQAIYDESRRLTEELDARIADLSGETRTIIRDERSHGKVYFVNLENNTTIRHVLISE